MAKISILGCEWLGLPLAKALVANGFEIKNRKVVRLFFCGCIKTLSI
jgi:hypothetical protein